MSRTCQEDLRAPDAAGIREKRPSVRPVLIVVLQSKLRDHEACLSQLR